MKILKKFFLNALSSFVGAWVAIVLLIAVAVMVCVGLVARIGVGEATPSVTRHSVMKISLSGPIAEAERAVDFDLTEMVQGNTDRPQTLRELVAALGEAKENKNIDALYLECDGVSASPATLNALRAAIVDFKKSGKKVIAYGDNYTQGDYYVASVADSVLMNPDGMLQLKGIGGTSIFMKDFFDKLGVTFQVCKVGTFKSAVEPYIQNEMSAPARAQLDTLYGVMWSEIKKQIASSRGIEAAQIDTLVSRDFITFRQPDFAKKRKLVDRLVFKREIDGIFADMVGVDKKKLNYVDAAVVAAQTDWGQAYSSKRQVAVLYMTGEIAEQSGAGIYCEKLVPEIVSLAEDDNVKAVVLRINSPGGSVFGTKEIAEALRYLKSKKKPLVVSMGDYAASGGYWISSEGDYIFADALTITGSIGIFGLLPEASGLMQKLGLSPQTVSTNPGANFPELFRPMSDAQRAAMQSYIDNGYEDFIAQVARGRKMDKSAVRRIAEGRVWNAMTAREIGLVDKIGSLQDAVEYAASKADLKDNYDVAAYPVFEPSLWDYIPQIQQGVSERLGGMMPGSDRKTLDRAARILLREPVQARMPEFMITF